MTVCLRVAMRQCAAHPSSGRLTLWIGLHPIEIMKCLLLALLPLVVPAMAAAAPHPYEVQAARKDVSVNFLYEACSAVGETARGEIPYFDCESYVYGVLDSYLSIRKDIPLSQRACFPPTLPPWKALKISEPAMLNSRYKNMSAGTALIEMLRDKYPCER